MLCFISDRDNSKRDIGYYVKSETEDFYELVDRSSKNKIVAYKTLDAAIKAYRKSLKVQNKK